MAPILHCVRHAQGYHNLNAANHALRDPQLTPHGEAQCAALHAAFPHHARVELVVASPLTRTLDTALLSFDRTIASKGLRVIALPELQETSDLPCDTGSAPDVLARAFATRPVDLALVHPGWDSKRGRWAPHARAIEARAAEARSWLMARPEKEIVVVTHGGFLHYFTEDWTDHGKFEGTGWANTEFRSYRFDSSDPEKAHLVELPESRQRRSGDAKPLDETERTNLERTTSPPAKLQDHSQASAKGVQDIKAKV